MTLSKKDTDKFNKILDNILKRILITPNSTPREALYIETVPGCEIYTNKHLTNMPYKCTKENTDIITI